MKTVKFFTLGCKVNQYETQSIREQFIRSDFQELEDSLPADFYIINTCTVTQRADSQSFALIRKASKENSQAMIIVTGCLTELDEDRIRNTNNKILIVKNKDKNRLLHLLNENNPPNSLNSLNHHHFLSALNEPGIHDFQGHTRAFLKIQDGCNHSCSYCKVPLVRGISRSRKIKEIIEEADRLVSNGFKEIVLCGICLGSYGPDLRPAVNLVDVIKELEKIEGLLRIRLSSIEAGDVSQQLIEKMAESKKLCPHLHIPMQSGDDDILKMMNRNYRYTDYLDLIDRIKNRISQIAITTDVLVGFPGESEINFHHTLDLIKEIVPLKVHIFPYSRRAGTQAAANLKDGINPMIIKERMWRLKDIAQGCSLAYRKKFLNKDRDVLVENRLKENPDFWEGHTDNYLKVLVKSEKELKNQLAPFNLKKIFKDYILADFS